MSYPVPFKDLHKLSCLLQNNRCTATHTYFQKAPEAWGFTDRIIEEFHLVIVMDGKATYRFEETDIPMQQGDMIFVSPRFRHSVTMKKSERATISTMRFGLHNKKSGKLLKSAIPFFALSHRLKSYMEITDIFGQIHRMYLHPASRLETEIMENMLQVMICKILHEVLKPQEDNRRKPLSEIMEHIWKHPESRESVEELAAIAGLSPKHFFSKFQQQTGTTPNRYQIRSRCQAAKIMLAESTQSIKSIAYNLGYPDSFSFSKQFKKFVGVSPRKYRESP